ncbi:MAG TPA: NAD(P)-dependent oxidoreductase [Bacillales bacterium]
MGFEMNVLYDKRNRDLDTEQHLGAECRQLPQLLKESDFVCLTLILKAETRHIIDENELCQMKLTAVLINVGRGSLVNELALIEALKKDTITGAGLDVFEKEPFSYDSQLLSLENVMLSPHAGSTTEKNGDPDGSEVLGIY